MTPLIERFRGRLPVAADTPVVSLGEGSTPLLPAPRLSERLGVELWLKWEGANPTGSYKDRGMTVAVSKALEEGARAVVCASTGNTAVSMDSQSSLLLRRVQFAGLFLDHPLDLAAGHEDRGDLHAKLGRGVGAG